MTHETKLSSRTNREVLPELRRGYRGAFYQVTLLGLSALCFRVAFSFSSVFYLNIRRGHFIMNRHFGPFFEITVDFGIAVTRDLPLLFRFLNCNDVVGQIGHGRSEERRVGKE